MHNRNYCCYRHFKQGKGKHDPSCTHCYSHVPLGVINPIPASPNKQQKQTVPQLQIRSKPFRIQKRTHDYNQVENKQSLPKRLRQPRVYVQKIVQKFDKNKLVLPIKLSGNHQYQLAVNFFRKIGQSLPHKTKQQLYNIIKSYASENRIISQKNQMNILLNKNQFIDFIIKNFQKISYEQAESFWGISYNQLRFKDQISAEAFLFNFGKFYLQLINYNNTFSQAALRQRVIDLRVLLFDWFNNQICLKYNMKDMKQDLQNIQKGLKFSDQQQLFIQFRLIYDKCKKTQTKLRLLAETFFALTDNKFLTPQKVRQQMQSKIQQKGRKIQTSRKILKNFFETNDYTQTQKFAVTDIIQFCKQQNCDEKTISQIIQWIQGLFDYIYFVKNQKQNQQESKQLGLSLNFETRRLQCNNILQINAQIIKQYDHFLQSLYDQQVQILKNLTVIIKQVFEKMPKLQGHKKQIVQCNYIAQTLLRFVKETDLQAFWYLCSMISKYKVYENTHEIKEIMKDKPNQQQIKKNLKGLFTLPLSQNVKNDQLGSLSVKQPSVISKKDQVLLSIKKYNNIKQQKLIIKARPVKKNKTQQNQFQKQFNRQQQSPCKQYQNTLNQNKNIEISKTNENGQKIKIVQKKNMEQLCGKQHINCHCKTRYILQTSKQTNDTISTIQSLESRIFSLLNFDCN